MLLELSLVTITEAVIAGVIVGLILYFVCKGLDRLLPW